MRGFLKWSRGSSKALAIIPLFILLQYNNVVDGSKSSTTFSHIDREKTGSIVIIEKDTRNIIDNKITVHKKQKVLNSYQKYHNLVTMIKRERTKKNKELKKLKATIIKKKYAKPIQIPSRGEVEQFKTVFMVVTAYTAGNESTGKTRGSPAYGVTASGTSVQEGRTLACPKSMNFGTKIFIPYLHRGYICEDRGGAITEGRLDIYMESLKDAENFGKKEIEIEILSE